MATALRGFAAPGRIVAAGQELDDDDPVIKGREHLFELVEPPRRRVRTATAEPVIDEAGPVGNVAGPSDGEGRRRVPRPSSSG